jgi:hypothetical protein
MPTTIRILPETTETALCLSLSGMVSAEDYASFFDAPVVKMCNDHGYYNLALIYEETFEGWTPEAADLSFKCISANIPKARKTAYVNAPDSRMLMMKMLQPIMKAEVRYFESGQEQDAIAWVQA